MRERDPYLNVAEADREANDSFDGTFTDYKKQLTATAIVSKHTTHLDCCVLEDKTVGSLFTASLARHVQCCGDVRGSQHQIPC